MFNFFNLKRKKNIIKGGLDCATDGLSFDIQKEIKKEAKKIHKTMQNICKLKQENLNYYFFPIEKKKVLDNTRVLSLPSKKHQLFFKLLFLYWTKDMILPVDTYKLQENVKKKWNRVYVNLDKYILINPSFNNWKQIRVKHIKNKPLRTENMKTTVISKKNISLSKIKRLLSISYSIKKTRKIKDDKTRIDRMAWQLMVFRDIIQW